MNSLKTMFSRARKRIVTKLQNPRLLEIQFHTLHHWKAIIEHQKTKDLLHVQRLLGHRSIQNMLIYIDLESKLFNAATEGFTSRVAHDTGEACSLIESGFEYVTGEYDDGGKIFRKRN